MGKKSCAINLAMHVNSQRLSYVHQVLAGSDIDVALEL